MSFRISLLAGLVTLALFGLGYRAWFLQVYRGESLESRALANQTRVDPITAPRGRFLDRSERVLVENRVSIDVLLRDPRHRPMGEALGRLARVLGLPVAELDRKLPRRRTAGYYLPVVLKEEVGTRSLVRLLEDRIHLPSIVPREMLVRHYLYETFACHVLGRVGRIPPEDLASYLVRDYPPDAFVGIAGLERKYEDRLRGRDGIRKVRVDALGWPVGQARVSDPTPGHDLVLSLDLDIQLGLERALGARRGSVVAIDPATGDVLGLASSPRFDPNTFHRKVNADEWRRLAGSEAAPLLDRALEAAYQPGSTFKVLVALAALEAGMSPEETIVCTGKFELGTRIARCWKKGGHGPMTMVPALAHSCNVFFYQAGLRAGIDGMVALADRAGLGRASGIGVGGESPGMMPSPSRRAMKGGGGWTRGDTINVAIGQGEVLTTPFQMVRLLGAIENQGVLMKPRLVRAILGPDGTREEIAPEEASRLGVSSGSLTTVLAGMTRAVLRGTGARARVEDHEVYGKTGSAQNPAGRTHAWFVGVLKAARGSAAIAVCLENAGAGGAEAAPVAREALEAVVASGWGGGPALPSPRALRDSAPVPVSRPATRPASSEVAGIPAGPVEMLEIFAAAPTGSTPSDPDDELLYVDPPEPNQAVAQSRGTSSPAPRAQTQPSPQPPGPSPTPLPTPGARPGPRPAPTPPPPPGVAGPAPAPASPRPPGTPPPPETDLDAALYR